MGYFTRLKAKVMTVVAPLLGLDQWDISTSGGDYNFRRYDVSTGEWLSCGLPPDGHPDCYEWLAERE